MVFDYTKYTLKEFRAKINLIVIIILLIAFGLFLADFTITVTHEDSQQSYEVNEANLPNSDMKNWLRELLNWLFLTHFLANLGISLIVAILMYFTLEAVVSSKFLAALTNSILDTEKFSSFIPKNSEFSLLEAIYSKLSEGDKEFSECQKSIAVNQHKTYKLNKFITVSDLRYQFVVSSWDRPRSPAYCRDYFKIEGTLKYRRKFTPKKIKIAALFPWKDRSNSLITDPSYEFVWLIVLDKSTRKTVLDYCFKITEVHIRGSQIPAANIKVTNDDEGYYYEIDNLETELITDDQNDEYPYLIDIKFEALQERKYGFVAANVKYICKGFRVELDHSRADFVENVWGINHVVGSEFNSSDSSGTGKRYSIDHHGWILPESGVTISWGGKNQTDV